jgi:alkanesulfonate monooxygenase
MALRFHWSMSSAGGKLRGAQARGALAIQSLDSMLRFARHAEECEIESLLMAFGFHRPDPFTVAAALGALTTRIKFMVAMRSGVMSPTYFVQQVNTVAMLTGGRICLNIVAGHTPDEQGYYGDFLKHDERYERTDEFLRICAAFWRRDGDVNFEGHHYRVVNGKLNLHFAAPDRSAPEIYLGGSSAVAEQQAIAHADCLWRLPDTPDKLRARTLEIVEQGTEVGLLVSLIVRPTHAEAMRAAEAILEEVGQQPKRTHEEFARRSDSVAFTSTYALAAQNEWLTPYLWSGAVPYLGAPAMAIVGSPDDVADALFDFRAAGITQFLFMGWPDMEEMTNFHRDVLPLVRRREQREEARAV